MHVFEALQHLIDDVLLVDVFKDVGADDCMQVGVHEVEDKVNVAVVLGTHYVLNPDDVLVVRQLLQKDDLSECTLRIGRILKSVKVLLEGHDIFGLLVNRFPDNTIRSLTYDRHSNYQNDVTKSTALLNFDQKSPT